MAAQLQAAAGSVAQGALRHGGARPEQRPHEHRRLALHSELQPQDLLTSAARHFCFIAWGLGMSTMNEPIRPILTGHKALVVGIANDQSIAYGCAKAFRTAGAEVAVTWLNDKARPHVEPLAREVGATLTAPLD